MAVYSRASSLHSCLSQALRIAAGSIPTIYSHLTNVKHFREAGHQGRHADQHVKLRKGHAQAVAATGQACCLATSAENVTAIRCTLRDVPGQQADLLADTLLGCGAQSASITEHRPHDAEEQEIFDLQQGTRDVWDRCTVTAHFGPDHDVQGTLQVVRSAMQLEDLPADVSDIADAEWMEGICASYQPTNIVDDLWIIPSWSKPVDPDAMNIVVEPGLAFGTGEHPTTRLCLRMLHSMDLLGKHVIDYGTGSGVLSLLALKRGAKLAVGVDTDPVAVRAASQNGVLNRFDGRLVTLRCGPSIDDPEPLQSNPQGFSMPGEYDVCVANILQGPLLALAPRLTQYVKPGGHLLLSGILETQVPGIKAAYESSFEQFETYTEELWALVSAVKKPASHS